jgi:hypothetical protein
MKALLELKGHRAALQSLREVEMAREFNTK